VSLNEPIVEDANTTWILPRLTKRDYGGQVGEQDYAVRDGPQLAPGEPAEEREFFGEMLPVGRLREAIRRLLLAFSSCLCADFCHTILRKVLSAMHGGRASYLSCRCLTKKPATSVPTTSSPPRRSKTLTGSPQR